jgi:hypothetical protein
MTWRVLTALNAKKTLKYSPKNLLNKLHIILIIATNRKKKDTIQLYVLIYLSFYFIN